MLLFSWRFFLFIISLSDQIIVSFVNKVNFVSLSFFNDPSFANEKGSRDANLPFLGDTDGRKKDESRKGFQAQTELLMLCFPYLFAPFAEMDRVH